MTNEGVVTKLLPNSMAEVAVARSTACGGNCGSCEACAFQNTLNIDSQDYTNESIFSAKKRSASIRLQQSCCVAEQISFTRPEYRHLIRRTFVSPIHRLKDRNILFIIRKPHRHQMQLMIHMHFHSITSYIAFCQFQEKLYLPISKPNLAGPSKTEVCLILSISCCGKPRQGRIAPPRRFPYAAELPSSP